MKTFLYINPLTPEISFLVFQKNKTIFRKTLIKNLTTASTFPKILIDIIDIYGIDEIWCVNGPGPFTLMRIVTLTINSLTYTRNISLKSCHFFDLITNKNIPIIEANTREYITLKNCEMLTIVKEFLPIGTYEGIYSDIVSTENTKFIQYREDGNDIIDVFSLKPVETRISPVYFKLPHITCPKQ